MEKEHGRTVETAVEARAGFLDRPVLVVLTVSLTLGILILGLLWLGFTYRLTHVGEPFLPLSVLSNPVVRSGTLAASCAMGSQIGLTIFMPSPKVQKTRCPAKAAGPEASTNVAPVGTTVPVSLLQSGSGCPPHDAFGAIRWEYP